GRLRPFEDLVHQTRRLPTHRVTVRTIAGQSFTTIDKSRVREHGRATLLPSSLHDEPVDVQRAVGLHQDPIYLALADLGEGRQRPGVGRDRVLDQHHAQAWRSLAI